MMDATIHTSPAATNWYVITGAPCSGKTSVINELARRGFNVVHEAARAFIDKKLERGHSLKEIKADILSFERHILYEKVRIEDRLSKGRTIFLDRAVPDSIAYFRIEGLDTSEPLSHSRKVCYKKVFLFDQLAFKSDAVRSENRALAARIEALLDKSYRELGYTIVRIPEQSISRRIEMVLKHVTL